MTKPNHAAPLTPGSPVPKSLSGCTNGEFGLRMRRPPFCRLSAHSKRQNVLSAGLIHNHAHREPVNVRPLDALR